ncbi:MAG TPA: bifunctional oligoribonuclease/PAP phosphatase NrnA [Gemmatimonadaceae bacterium]|nr:bifunctional oligoribonuclease/PAP phosphatase NrnA [Gemmatimonadaceae bacterium]
MIDLLEVPADRRAAAHAIWNALDGARTVALSTHINADGDGCGSQAALARLLAQRGIAAYVCNPTPWPTMFKFLLGNDVRDRSDEGIAAINAADQVIVLDISDIERLGVLADSVRKHKKRALVIDHHRPGVEAPGEIMLSDVTACATGELIYDFATTLGFSLTKDAATAMYTAILTDTGSFRYANASPRSHAVAADLLRVGVDPEEMYRLVYASVPLGRLRLVRDALATLEVDSQAGLSWIDVPAGAMDKYGLSSEDLDGIAEYPRMIAGTRIALLFRDLGHGKVKVSFRSTGNADVHTLARQFGGGGHSRASGAMIPGTLETVRKAVVDAARQMLVDNS